MSCILKALVIPDRGALTGDLITFLYESSSEFKFGHDGSDLILTGKDGTGSLRINNFTNGAIAYIKFSDANTPMTYDTIKNKAWLS